MLKVLWAVLIVAGALALFVVLYVLNRKTPRPADCPKDELPEGCGSCMLSCGVREKEFEVKNLISQPSKTASEKDGETETDINKEEEQ